jgi:ABC-type Na+ efflux pump permease subunit
MVIWTLASKDFRLLLRDARAIVILLAMPLIFIIVLGVSLGEDFGKRDKLRVSVLNLDEGVPLFPGQSVPSFPPESFRNATLKANEDSADSKNSVKGTYWSAMVLKDLTESSGIFVELIPNAEEADRLIKSGRRAAILVLGPDFSKRVQRCSFLAAGWRDTFFIASCFPRPGQPIEMFLNGCFNEGQTDVPLYLNDGINPFYRDGVLIKSLDVTLLRDETQQMSAAIVEQAAQGSFLRVVMPWMIGRAFEKIGDPDFLTLLGNEKEVPFLVRSFLTGSNDAQKKDLGSGLKKSLQRLFPRYNLTAKTWASLTKESEHTGDGDGKLSNFAEDGEGWLKRGATRYQLLVPAYLVMFAFFLVLTVGWLFVAERRQGTLVRLRAAPLARWQILLGKLLPCFIVSLFQGFFLLLAGKLIFNMNLGPLPFWLVPLVAATSFAAMGLALLVASLARTETQVAVYGTLLVLILAGVSGALMGDRSQVPEALQMLRRFTPHDWALEAYRQLLANSGTVDIGKVAECCGMLSLFGVIFVTSSWWLLRLE